MGVASDLDGCLCCGGRFSSTKALVFLVANEQKTTPNELRCLGSLDDKDDDFFEYFD